MLSKGVTWSAGVLEAVDLKLGRSLNMSPLLFPRAPVEKLKGCPGYLFKGLVVVTLGAAEGVD